MRLFYPTQTPTSFPRKRESRKRFRASYDSYARYRVRWIPAFAGMTLLFCVVLSTQAHAAKVKEITTSSGIKAWLVEDHKLPLIAVHFAFRGGVEQDPADKQGLATLSMEMLTQGAGTYDAATFQQRLSDHSIAMDFNTTRDALAGSVKTLSADRQEAFSLLSLAVTQPKIDIKDFERMRGQQLSMLRTQFDSPDWQARYALFHKIFGKHPYGERRLGTTATLSRLTQNDVKNFLAAHLARDNLMVSVAGDITPAELTRLLDETFGTLPRHARETFVGEVEWPQDTPLILVPREGTQTALLFSMPGPKQDSPDWYAAEIANYILGGGGFSSRLMQDVRDKKGLTYGVDTLVSPAEHCGLILGQAATDNSKTKEAWEIMLQTMRHFYDDGVSVNEINMAKDYLTGSLPLALTSTDRIANVLVSLQLERRPANYLDIRNDRIRAVTPDEVQNAIRRWFNPDRLTLSMVGKPEGLIPTETQSLVRE